MEGIRLILREIDVPGAILPCSVISDNTSEDLRRWLTCRGFTTRKTDSQQSLIKRVQDLIESGMGRYVLDPDGDITAQYIASHSLVNVPQPQPNEWTHDLSCIPSGYSYACVVHYLIRRKIKVINEGSDDENKDPICLPIAQKPLRKGFNFYASGHISNIMTNSIKSVVHIVGKILSSYKEKVYDTNVVIERGKGVIVKAGCNCVAGRGGKCNHVAGLLFALLDFCHSLHNAPESCTSMSQQWHKPPRIAKRHTQPTLAGRRKLEKHEYGKTPKRKRALEGYQEYNVLRSSTELSQNLQGLKKAFRKIKDEAHNAGILQVLDSSTTSASEEDGSNASSAVITATPHEKVLQRLQVTVEQQSVIQTLTVDQSENPEWFKQKKGRITASNAKRCCGNPSSSLLRALITLGRPSRPSVPSLMYGIENEEVAAQQYLQEKHKQGMLIGLKKCGIFVDTDNGQLAASPDRIVVNEAGLSVGLLEVKCMYASRTMSPPEAVIAHQNKSTFPVKHINGRYKLKTQHQYYYQIQMQMGITKFPWCDLALFTNVEEDVLVIRVEYDPDFWNTIKPKLLDFHHKNVLPALIAQGFGI